MLVNHRLIYYGPDFCRVTSRQGIRIPVHLMGLGQQVNFYLRMISWRVPFVLLAIVLLFPRPTCMLQHSKGEYG